MYNNNNNNVYVNYTKVEILPPDIACRILRIYIVFFYVSSLCCEYIHVVPLESCL
jgi:hypothetical protein